MVNLLKKYWFIFLLGGIATVLFLVKTVFPPQPQPPSLERLPLPKFIPEEITNRTINYQFNLSLPTDFPQNMPVYKILNLEARTFPETKPDLGGNTLVSSDSAAVEIAREFLREKNIDNGLFSFIEVSYRLVEKMEAFPATTSARANIFVVDFWGKTDETKILSDKPVSPLASIWVGKNGRVQKAFAMIFSLAEPKLYPLRPPTIAQQDIVAQKGTLVWLEKEEDYGPLPPQTTIENLMIEGVFLAYFLPPPGVSHLEPIYVFEGKAQLVGGRVVGTAIYLPAIEEKLLFFYP